MTRPVLRLKTKKPENAANCPQCDGWLVYQSHNDSYACAKCDYRGAVGAEETKEPTGYPQCWTKGQLLNVRYNGTTYVVTLLNEEFDRNQPERALTFDNSFACNNFLASWYSSEAHDPRAI